MSARLLPTIIFQPEQSLTYRIKRGAFVCAPFSFLVMCVFAYGAPICPKFVASSEKSVTLVMPSALKSVRTS